MKLSPNSNLDNTHLLTCGPWLRLGMSNVKHASFMYITLTCIHLDQWKSFMKFGAKKSYEMRRLFSPLCALLLPSHINNG